MVFFMYMFVVSEITNISSLETERERERERGREISSQKGQKRTNEISQYYFSFSSVLDLLFEKNRVQYEHSNKQTPKMFASLTYTSVYA